MQCIGSIQVSNFGDHVARIIVVDDCSDDFTASFVRSFPIGRILYLKTNTRSYSTAKPSALGWNFCAEGDVVYVIADDHILDPDWIRIVADFMQSHPQVGCIGGYQKPKRETIVSRLEHFTHVLAGLSQRVSMIEPTIGGKEIPAGNVYRSIAILQAGGFYREDLVTGEDFELKDRIVDAGYRAACIPQPPIIHNQDYDWNYMVTRMWRRGLERMPPKRFVTLKLIPMLPLLAYKATKKIIRFRQKAKK